LKDPDLATIWARAYVDGFQSTDGRWARQSVSHVKHWPGGGPEEGGRDGHFGMALCRYPGKEHCRTY